MVELIARRRALLALITEPISRVDLLARAADLPEYARISAKSLPDRVSADLQSLAKCGRIELQPRRWTRTG